MATNWDLRAFIFGLEDLDDDEKNLCFSILDGEGFSAATKRRAFFALDDADLQTAGISKMSTRKVLRLAIAGTAAGLGLGSPSGAVAKTITVAHMVVTPGEDKKVVDKITFKDQESFKDFLRNANTTGLVRVPDEDREDEEETVLIQDISDLEDGQRYYIRFEGQCNSITSIRQEQTHLSQRQEDEAVQAVLRDCQLEDPTCSLDPLMRVFNNTKGRAELETDGTIVCESRVIVLSQKTNYTHASLVKAIADDAEAIMQKSSDPAYTGTLYAQFRGKKVMPAFMVECVQATNEASLRSAGQEHGVKLYRRNGSSISPWASMTPLKRVAARPAVMRWVV